MREIRTTLLPNGEQQVQAGGDFVYVDYVDREIKLMIHDQVITVNAGDKVRPARPFKSVTVINPNGINSVAVVLKVGEGDYNSQIIRGEVTVNPGLRTANGQWVSDSRVEHNLRVSVNALLSESYEVGDLVRQKNDIPVNAVYGSLLVTALGDDQYLISDLRGNGWTLLRGWEIDQPKFYPMEKMGHGAGVKIGNSVYIPQGRDNGPEADPRYTVDFNVYDSRSLVEVRTLRTNCIWRSGNESSPSFIACAFDPRSERFFLGNSVGHIDVISLAGAWVDSLVLGVHVPDMTYRGLVYKDDVINPIFQSVLNDINGDGVFSIDPETYEKKEWKLINWHAEGFTSNAAGGAYDEQKDSLFLCSNTKDLSEFAFKEYEVNARGRATRCNGGGSVKSVVANITAKVNGGRLADGKMQVSGELIKMVLELYYRHEPMPVNYLDYVHRVEFEEADGVSPRVVDTGGESFQLAEIKDDFSAAFPQRVKITLREGII